MKKKILGGIAVLAIATVAVLNVNFNVQENSSSIGLENVEALANGEGGGTPALYCYNRSSSEGDIEWFLKCYSETGA